VIQVSQNLNIKDDIGRCLDFQTTLPQSIYLIIERHVAGFLHPLSAGLRMT